MSDKEEQAEDFEYWLANMDDFLDDFFKVTPKEISTKLDYSPRSLIKLEEYILETYSSVEDTRNKNESSRLNGLSIYVGEVFRKGLGGKWYMELEDEGKPYYGVPSLIDFGPKHRKEAPLYLVTTAVDRRRGTLLFDTYQRRSR